MRIVFSAAVLSALSQAPWTTLARSQSNLLRRPSSTAEADILRKHLVTVQKEEEQATNNRRRNLAISPGCPGEESFTTSFTKPCTYESLVDKLNSIKSSACAATGEQILLGLLGETDPSVAGTKVKELCVAAYENSAETFPFSEITRKGKQFDNEYYSGGTFWNYEIQTDSGENELKTDAARVKRIFEDQAQSKIIDLPTYLPAFDPEGNGCDLNAAFCCWVQDRQAGDNNGNCNTPYESQCIDKDPGDNTNFCYTDHSRSSAAHHVDGGFSVFGNVLNGQENIEGAVHCHGFAWAEDDDDISGVYKGNNLFFVSMYDHMHQRGYVRNAPGCAMCGCAENMAVVTRADCTEIAVEERFTFDYNATTATFSGVLVEVRDVDFNACQGKDANGNNKNNDLEAYYRRLVNEERQSPENFAELQKILVGTKSGNCNNAIVNFMMEKGIYRPVASAEAPPAVAGADEPMIAGGAETAAAPAEPDVSGGTVEAIDPSYEKASEGGDGSAMPEVPTDLAEGEDAQVFVAPTPAPKAETVETAEKPPAPVEEEEEELPLKGEGEECVHGWDCMSGRCLGSGHCSAIHKNNPGYDGGKATCAQEGDPCQNQNDCCDSAPCGGKPKVCGGVSLGGVGKNA